MRRLDRRRIAGTGIIAVLSLVASASCVGATDLYKPSNWTAMASDRLASKVGDSLTVLVYETSQAQNSSQTSKQGSSNLSGQFSAGSVSKGGQLGLSGSYSGSGQTERAGQIMAQISVVVDEVLANGDLHVSGEQMLNINGARTRIRLKGRVRHEDISSTNTVLSSMLADATIDYGGAGGAGKGGDGVVGRVLGWVGLR